ncbi:SNF1-related protein kinase regulatory subunit beta-2 [Diplonema papillatum]|nr:SNF1-related protein kinase regulatory subunit beta-2 [Diplonema papillatum]
MGTQQGKEGREDVRAKGVETASPDRRYTSGYQHNRYPPATRAYPPPAPGVPGAPGAAQPGQDSAAQGTAAPPASNPSSVSLRAVQASCARGDGIPTIIKWPSDKAKRVFVEGTFTNWGKGLVELQRSNSEFMSIVYLQPGMHTYRYIVDGQEMIDGTQVKIHHEKGEFNTICVQDKSILGADSEDESVLSTPTTDAPKPYTAANADEKDSYSQVRWVFEETRKLPPMFPPHLRFTPLSTPAEARPTNDQVLPAPYHVTINHMYFQSRDDYNVIGATYRHGEKFSSVVYYTSVKPIRKAGHADPNADIQGSPVGSAPISCQTSKPTPFY